MAFSNITHYKKIGWLGFFWNGWLEFYKLMFHLPLHIDLFMPSFLAFIKLVGF